MAKIAYLHKADKLINRIQETQQDAIVEASRLMANSIASGKVVHLFGSGHSVIPVMDIFPRYGSYVGFNPLMDPRLMWSSVVGPGGARELLWLEREEGYIRNFLQSFVFDPEDTMVVFSHGGLNAAPIEVALFAKEQGMRIIAITSRANYRIASATHSSGKKLGDLADVLIDNCVPLEDAMVSIDGLDEPVGAGSTLAVVAISMSLVSETARLLVADGKSLSVFVSPNVEGIGPDHNASVFEEFEAKICRIKSE
ncbi:MAG TPA: SIS domain-containing protein [Bacillota bacterium]|nr:SIS domain-containing protein [Bacillota bacterium]